MVHSFLINLFPKENQSFETETETDEREVDIKEPILLLLYCKI